MHNAVGSKKLLLMYIPFHKSNKSHQHLTELIMTHEIDLGEKLIRNITEDAVIYA
jgi:hypothetical protein